MPPAVAHELSVMAEQCTGRGVRGVVAAAAPLAAVIGTEVLRDGGNAFDAVVAMALAESVLLPPKCGLGGDLIALCVRPGGGPPEALLAVGPAVRGMDEVARAGRWSDVGANAVGPPGAPAGHLALAERGRLGLGRLAAPAIALALDGFPWAEVATRLSIHARDLVLAEQPDGCVYFPDGAPIAPGTVVRLPGLAAALEEFVARRDTFLDGPVGAAIARVVGERGGCLDPDTVSAATAAWAPCATGTLGARTLWTTPAPTHGPALIDAASRLDPTDPVAGTYRAVLEAIRNGRERLSDPSGTSMVSAADRDGNVVVVVHSNSYPRFGSGIVVPEYDLVLANRAGRGFTPIPGHPNFPMAGRRPATTLHAWAVSDDSGRPRLVGATPGGDNQMPWNAQALARIASGLEDPGLLVTSPLWEWIPADDGVRIEGGFEDGAIEALRAVAPRSSAAPRWGCKSAQQVVRVARAGEALVAAADPRTVGSSLGL
ncbi:MAG: gamma-glutamyltransferase [Ilumatobacteraceae bacterium]